MKQLVFGLIAIIGLVFQQAQAAEHQYGGKIKSVQEIEQPRFSSSASLDETNGHPYDQVLSMQIGPYKPRSIIFTNWNNNTFDYSKQEMNSFAAELGWSIKAFHLGGTSVSIGESLFYSTFSLKLPANLAPTSGNASVTMHMFGFDTRLIQAWETFPIEAAVPFWEAGYQYTLYSQTGSSDLVAGEGAEGNFVAGLGMRYWLNRGASLNRDFPGRYIALPIFLTAKLNQIFPNNAGFDPGNTTVLGGLSVGL